MPRASLRSAGVATAVATVFVTGAAAAHADSSGRAVVRTPADVPPSVTAVPLGPWVPQGSSSINSYTQGQGLATVTRPDGSRYLWYTGEGSIPAATRQAGWVHVGDPDSARGYVVEPYQGRSGSKMFRIWTPDPDHTAHDFEHRLASGEAFNNSFAAVTFGGQWLVSGEYGTMNRFLVFPMPMVNPSAPGVGANLPLAATIRLNRPVRDVQGCVFVTATRLMCSSDDPAGDLFGVSKPLLQVDLSNPISGSDVTGYVTALGQLPLESPCSGTFETEGIDYDWYTGDLRVEVLPPVPCIINGTLWRYRQAARAGAIRSGLASTKCVDDYAASDADGTKVVLYDCNGSAAQYWRLENDGTIRIHGKCLDIAGSGWENGALVNIWRCHGGGNQQWATQGDGALQNPASGRCLDVPGSTTANGTQLVIWDCNGGSNQRWILP